MIFRKYKTIDHRGQRYECTAVSARFAKWKSECATCGSTFTFTTPVEVEEFSPNRRCAKHRKPGLSVERERDKKQKARAAPLTVRQREAKAKRDLKALRRKQDEVAKQVAEAEKSYLAAKRAIEREVLAQRAAYQAEVEQRRLAELDVIRARAIAARVKPDVFS